MLEDYLIIFCGPKVVAIAKQLVKVSINSFCNAINATFSNTGKGRKLRVNSKYYQEKQNKHCIRVQSIFLPQKVLK